MEGEHVAVGDAELSQSLGVVADELSIVVEMLGDGIVSCLGLDRIAKGLDRHLRVDFQGQQILVVVPGFRVRNGERNAPRLG